MDSINVVEVSMSKDKLAELAATLDEESVNILIDHPRDDDDVDDAPAPKIAKIAAAEPTLSESAALLGQCVQDAVSPTMWDSKDGGDFAEVLGAGFEFYSDIMKVKITGADLTATYKLVLVKVFVADASRTPFTKPTSSKPTLAELVSLLFMSIEDILRDVLWYENGGEYEEVLGKGFEFCDDTLNVKITAADGTATYEVKLVKVEEDEKE